MASVSAALQQRISTRAFLETPVPEDVMREMLEKALRAPSGGNTQPWHIYVLTGDARDSLTRKAQKKKMSGQQDKPEYMVYPDKSVKPKSWHERQVKVAEKLYAAQGIESKDKKGRMLSMVRNWDFFGAPVGCIITVDRVADRNGWAHAGMLLQSLCLLAEERGLATCCQEAWGNMGRLVYDELAIPDTEMVWCGLALGYPDPENPINQWRTEREPLDQVAKFRGFAVPASKL